MEFFFIAIVLLSLLPVIVFAVIRKTKSSQRLQGLAQKLSAAAIEPGRQYSGTADGVDYSYQYYPGSKNRSSSFTIQVNCVSRGEFRLSPENAVDRFFRNFGICCEIQTGDPEFDRKFYIQTNQVSFAGTYFAQPDKRQAAGELFAMGFNEIFHDGKILHVQQSPFRLTDRINEEFVLQAVAQIKVLARNIPQDYPRESMAGIPVWKIWRVIGYGGAALFLVAGLFLFIVCPLLYKPLDAGELFLFSLKYSVPLFILWMAVVVQMIKGRSSSHKELMIIFLLSLIGIPLAGNGVLTGMNGYFDTRQAVSHHCWVVYRYVSHHEETSSPTYYIQAESWRQGKVHETLAVPFLDYNSAVPGKAFLDITTKPGRYGFEWLVGYSVVNAK